MGAGRSGAEIGDPTARRPARARPGWGAAAVLAIVALVAAACGGGTTPAAAPGGAATPGAGGSTGTPPLRRGGAMTVLLPGSTEANWPQGLDPATDGNGGSNEDLEGAIFGSLFELGPGGTTLPDLATGYRIEDGGRAVAITLRHGVRFSDGTPFDAAAVVFNWRRDFQAGAANTPQWPLAATDPFTTEGDDTAVIHLAHPYSPLINSLHTRSVNFIGSPAALQRMGLKQFTLTPVGAGPFVVVSDTPSTELVLKRNPTYWKAGHPFLDRLTFKAAASDESALEAMQSGQAQVYKDMTTLQLVKAFSSSFDVTEENTASPTDVQMNTKLAPFDDIRAREALYDATDAPTLDKRLFDDVTPVVQGFTGPGGLYYDPTVPGYRTYDLAKAKALVKAVGGMSFQLLAGQSETNKTLAEALQTLWQAAGMKVSLSFVTTPQVVQDFDSGHWQADLSADGAFDPATGVAQMFRFLSTSPFSGVHDPALDALLNQATEVQGDARKAVYERVARYESDHAYVVQLFPSFVWNVADRSIYAPGLTTVIPATEIVPEVLWEDAGYTR